jgi:two-component system LytT family response regulator
VIFTTAHDQFAITAFELAALDYLLKPFGRERFARAIERARPLLERDAGTGGVERAREVLTDGPLPRLFVRDAGRIVPLRAASVEWLQACDDFVIVHAGGRQFRVNLTLADLERRLDPRVFVRVHRSHLVNLDHVMSWTPYDGSRLQITLRSGRTLMASRQRSRALRELSTGRKHPFAANRYHRPNVSCEASPGGLGCDTWPLFIALPSLPLRSCRASCG